MKKMEFDVEKFKKEFYKSDKTIAHVEKKLGCSLSKFFEHYVEKTHPKLKRINDSIVKDCFMKLMNPELQINTQIPHINSIKARVKDPYHFIDKLVRKVCTDSEYDGINLNNYHLYFDDLLGFRVILLYLEDWYELHENLLGYFPYDENKLVKKPFRVSIPKDAAPFMVSKPEINIRNGDDEDVYKLHYKSDSFEHSFKLKNGRYYRSIHYSVFYKGSTFEIQVRSLFDEAWSEVDHDVLYPLFMKNKQLVEFSKQMNRVAGLGNEMASYFRNVLKESVPTPVCMDEFSDTLSAVPDELALLTESFNTDMNSNRTNETDDTGNSSSTILDNIIKGE